MQYVFSIHCVQGMVLVGWYRVSPLCALLDCGQYIHTTHSAPQCVCVCVCSLASTEQQGLQVTTQDRRREGR